MKICETWQCGDRVLFTKVVAAWKDKGLEWYFPQYTIHLDQEIRALRELFHYRSNQNVVQKTACAPQPGYVGVRVGTLASKASRQVRQLWSNPWHPLALYLAAVCGPDRYSA